ncbi:hypothetical protein ACFL08_00865 [Patescibacteria group bacterium]
MTKQKKDCINGLCRDGKVHCATCFSTGRILKNPCSTCRGTGVDLKSTERDCPTCKSARVKGLSVDDFNKHRMDKTFVKEFIVDCGVCSGTGLVPCPKCVKKIDTGE